MPSFETHASAIGGDTLDWEAEWRMSPLPEEEKDQWKAAIKHISVTPRLAERLSQHGWRPEQLTRSMEDPMYLIDLSREYIRGPEAKSAFLVLVGA
ncbi:hypothetical protein NG697_06200 [Pseudarthrobacter sp. MDT3-26]|uniref:hypothetical protein n=1 Tax=Pseudarthrobacter raffinosi TaxID=2953651 RepID=UPI00208F958E|nr:hypothetical protein [Pseudarthrobacter sp. MDT3-26]MCO4262520.1 hypothetical protein [Pseudarthrobacter sp. MDT3-26]